MNIEGLSSQSRVNDFVHADPNHAMQVFQMLGIDCCCGGAKSLQAACEEKGLDPDQVLDQLKHKPD